MNKLLLILAAILSAVGGIFGIHRAGKKAGRNETELEMHREDSDHARINKEIEHEVITSDSDANRDRLQKWNRD